MRSILHDAEKSNVQPIVDNKARYIICNQNIQVCHYLIIAIVEVSEITILSH